MTSFIILYISVLLYLSFKEYILKVEALIIVISRIIDVLYTRILVVPFIIAALFTRN